MTGSDRSSCTRAAIVILLVSVAIPLTLAKNPGRDKVFAQKLVEETLPKHPEVTSIEISARSSRGCMTIASNDPKDLHEKCDSGESGPMRTGKPFVEKEEDGSDITLPLHDTGGKIIGAVGMDFKPEPGQRRSDVIKQATQIVRELEARISSSQAKLLEPAR
jgi:hypothetical protein